MVNWRGRAPSRNVEDRRGSSGGIGGAGFGRAGMGRGGTLPFFLIRLILNKFGIAGIAILAGGYFLLQAVGLDPMGMVEPPGPQTQQTTSESNEQFAFASVMLAETENVWGQIFEASGERYPQPTLVVFSGQTRSGCGGASSASGPFYCPADRKLYLDTSFFDELAERFGAPGDFASAYVIAHEVGHHVQNLTGTLSEVQQQQRSLGEAEANALQVRVELQADCYAGVWAHYADRTAGLLEEGDIAEGLDAAAAIGDDRLQRNAGRRVDPDSFTHGTSAQRQEWFMNGYRGGNPGDCDTFSNSL